MQELVVAFDVGGTNSRARIASLGATGHATPASEDLTSRGTSAREFYDFVGRVSELAKGHGTVVSAVVAMAGMVDGEQGRMTNWPSDTLVELSQLVGSGLPAGQTHLINDVVAGVWGARARVEDDDSSVPARRLDAFGTEAQVLGDGCIVYVAPGTGLGTASLVRHGLGSRGATAVACETQHMALPRFEGGLAQVVDVLERTLGRPPEWEDLISGRGLVGIYESQRIALALSRSGAIADALDAGAIARAAAEGDEQALAATDAFYRTLGHYVQMLALTFLPCAAVVIGGNTTELNLDLLQRSGLAETFATHRRFGDLLGRIPLYTVGGEVNLEGGVWLAEHH